jgi:hypothetical protein
MIPFLLLLRLRFFSSLFLYFLSLFSLIIQSQRRRSLIPSTSLQPPLLLIPPTLSLELFSWLLPIW